MNKYKKYLSKKEYIIFLLALIITLSSFSYAFFLSIDTFNNNIATTECFNITLQDKNDIYLDKTYPLSEEEGTNLRPYTFTIKNVCKESADYQVNIETFSSSTLNTQYLRVKVDNTPSSKLGLLEEDTEYINPNIGESNKIIDGSLLSNEEVTYNIRLWIDEDATVEQSSNKIYSAKVVVKALENKTDVMVAYYYDGEKKNVPPLKSNGYILTNLECINADGEWDDKEWKLSISNFSNKVKCQLSFSNNSDNKIIELNPNGGLVSTQYLKRQNGTQLGEIPIPVKEGMIFDGWYKNIELTDSVDSTTEVTNDITTLYAKYKTQSSIINLGTGTSFNIQTLAPDVDYTKLTVDNFIIGTTSASQNIANFTNGNSYKLSTGGFTGFTLNKSYNNTTGILTISGNSYTTWVWISNNNYSTSVSTADSKTYGTVSTFAYLILD